MQGEQVPGTRTDLYRFDAAAGDRIFFGAVAVTAPGIGSWRDFDAFGNAVVPATGQGTVVETLLLTSGGTYTVAVEGSITNAAVVGYAFNLVPVEFAQSALTVGARVDGAIGAPGESDFYTFTLWERSFVHFDSLANVGTLNWSLAGPAGAHVSARRFNSADHVGAILDLPAGDYTQRWTAR